MLDDLKYFALEFGSIRVIANPWCPETVRRQVKFPRSKKARIRKKWARKGKNFTNERVMYFIGTNEIMAHPKNVAMIVNFKL
jgi:hypothetical protein